MSVDLEDHGERFTDVTSSSHCYQLKSTLTVKPAGFHMHATPRKDMRIDPTLSAQASVLESIRSSTCQAEATDDTVADNSRQRVYIYYGQ